LVNSSSLVQNIILNNSGSGSLLITSVTISGANSSEFTETNNCGASLGGNNGSCTINITFTPTATGASTATLTILDNNNGVNNTQQTAALTGTGVAPTATLSSTAVSFGLQAVGKASAPQTVTLTNTGTAPLTIATIVLIGKDFGDFSQSSTCPITPATLAAGTNCTISIIFTPAAQTPLTANIVITDNDSGNAGSTQTVVLTGTGSGPSVSLSPTTLTFPSQPVMTSSSIQTITFTNSGGLADTITAIKVELNGVPTKDFTETDTCLTPTNGGVLAAGASCTISVTFVPQSVGTFSGVLGVEDTAPNSPHFATLTGTGADFSLGLTPTSISLPAGQTATYNLQITPGGGFNQTIALTCSGNPALSICGFSPGNSVTLDGTTTANYLVNITTTARATLVPPENTWPNPGLWVMRLAPGFSGATTLLGLWLLILAALAGYFVFGRRRARVGFSLAVLGVLLVASLALPSCGGSGAVTTPPAVGTPAGTYTITITGTFGTLTRTTTVTLKVT
jgi:hypothetical protein